MSEAVLETVEKQVRAGINIVSDGETSKISYATYVKDRYTGFDGDSPVTLLLIYSNFPRFLSAWQMMVERRSIHGPCVLER